MHFHREAFIVNLTPLSKRLKKYRKKGDKNKEERERENNYGLIGISHFLVYEKPVLMGLMHSDGIRRYATYSFIVTCVQWFTKVFECKP